jgi:4-amino-4-deoxy-L-arabinose transferase
MLSRSRLPLYVLPLFAPIALWLARRFEPIACELQPGRIGQVAVTCLLLLTAAKFGIGQLSPPKADGRATAALIASASGGQADEVVYVDRRAAWALRFYLDTQVREAWLRRSRSEPLYREPPTLTDLLARDDGSAKRVFVVNPASTHDFEQALREAGFCAQPLGRDAVSVVYRAAGAGTASCPRGAVPAGGNDDRGN